MLEQIHFPKYPWIIMLVLSIAFLVPTTLLLVLSGGIIIIEQGLVYAGSEFDVTTIESAALGYLSMSMLKPLWEELWIGFLGFYLAFQLRKGKRFAWGLSLLWGIMQITNAIIQGLYELVILNWSTACMQTYLFLLVGVIVVVSLLIARKGYFTGQVLEGA